MFRIGSLRQTAPKKRRRWRKTFSGTCQEQIEPEQSVIRDKPDVSVPLILFVLPHAGCPERLGTHLYRFIKGIEGSPELLPDAFLQDCVHLMPSELIRYDFGLQSAAEWLVIEVVNLDNAL
jgi:hypothetical protein